MIGIILEAIVKFILTVIIYTLIIGFLVKWLWNWLMPELFGLPDITFWQAWGLSFLSGLLFKNTSNSSE